MRNLGKLLVVLVLAAALLLSSVAIAEEPLTVNLLLYGDESNRMRELKKNEFHQVALEQANVDLQISYVP